MKIKHIYWFANFNMLSPSVRYRGKYALDFFKEKHNISYTFIYPSYRLNIIIKFLITFVEILFFRKANAIVIIENVYTQKAYATLLKMLVYFNPKNTLYDIDDAEYERFPPKTIHYFMRKCERCTVGSYELENYTKKFNPNVFLLTSPVIQHNFIKTQLNEKMVIGWIGFFSAHKKGMYDLFLPALKLIPFPLKFCLMGVNHTEDKQAIIEYYADCQHIELSFCEPSNWLKEEEIYQKISTFDVGISTLLDTPLHLAKSAFKLKQYMSCGVPVLANAKGEHLNFLKVGINGYFCNTPLEFAVAIINIRKLSPEKYCELSRNARASYHHFDMKKYCHSLLHYYENLN